MIIDHHFSRKNTSCFKWDKNKEGFKKEDIISMWVADMDLASDPEITQALVNRAKHPAYGYTFRNEDFYRAYINWQKRRNNWDIKKEWILNSNSVVISMNLILRAVTSKNARIMIMPPVYNQFALTVKATGRKLITSPLINNNGFYSIDFIDLEDKFKKGTEALILCSPHNPVGRVWKKEELMKISELCLKYNVLLISDEIHSDLIMEGNKHFPTASLSPEISNITMTCTSPGKTFNISGLGIGFIIIENEILRNKVNDIFLSHHLMASNIFAIEACHTAYSKSEKWLQEVLIHLKRNRDYLVNFINTEIPLLKVYPPQGTYLAWLDFRKLGLCQQGLLCFLIFAAGLGLDNGTKFGVEGKGFMRLNFACSSNLMKQALNQLAQAVTKLKKADFDLKNIVKEKEVIDDYD